MLSFSIIAGYMKSASSNGDDGHSHPVPLFDEMNDLDICLLVITDAESVLYRSLIQLK